MSRRIIALLLALCVIAFADIATANSLQGAVTASMLYVRAQPNSESDTIHFIKSGEKVTVLQKVNEWYNVLCENGAKGYVYAQFIRLGEGGATADTGVVIPQNILNLGDRGTEVRSMQQALSNHGYYKGSIDGIFGPGTLRAVKSFQRDNRLTVDGIVGQSTIRSLFGDAAITDSNDTTAEQNQQNDDQKTTAEGTVILPSTLTLGDRGKDVSTVQQALSGYGYYKGKIDGIFGPGTLRAVELFQRKNRLTVDGLVGKSTARALFSDTAVAANPKDPNAVQNPPKDDQNFPPAVNETPNQPQKPPVSTASSRTKSLDWFRDGKDLIRNNKNITIKDLNTGVTWNALYANGSNHADIYPASVADVRKITNANITGSYVRRPVIATIAGTNYAGSMYAVPHGSNSYCNYYDSVMCLHFTGSKTHGTNKVDADHQKAIQVALAR